MENINSPLPSDTNGQSTEGIAEILYDKTYVCPVCDHELKSKAIRSGKNRVISTDTDLYSQYSMVNPLFYDVIVCTYCGYAALSKNFDNVRPAQVQMILSQITYKYHAKYYPDILTTELAIERYKLALLNSMVKQSRMGEKAYICLKLGWLYRDLGDNINEEAYLTHAKEGFIEAFSSERFPIFELDDVTTMYIIADISRRYRHYDEALKWVNDLIINGNIGSALKNRALDLRDLIKEEMKQNKNA